MMDIDFEPLFYGLIAIGVAIGLVISGLVYGGCRLVSKYDIKIEKVEKEQNENFIEK